MIHTIHQNNPGAIIDVYGHSMGGLVARWAIEKGSLSTLGPAEGIGGDVDRLFTLGTPHWGVPLDAIRAFCINYPAGLLQKWGINALTLVTLPGVHDLIRDNSFLSTLDDGHYSSHGKTRAYIPYAGLHYEGYISIIGIVINGIYAGGSPSDIPFDGIVPLQSAQYKGLDLVAQSVWKPEPILNFNHSDLAGLYVRDTTKTAYYNYDRNQFSSKLSTFILEQSGVTVGVN